jgi:hypothetical protein
MTSKSRPKGPFLFLEGKESSRLPRRSKDQPKLWADLCLFGFATKIARSNCSNTKEEGRASLSDLLGLETLHPDKRTTTTHPPSLMADALLSVPPVVQILSVAQRVNMQLEVGKIEPTDPVNLWAAVMQACHYYSVANKRKRSIVVSARMFWYIELETAEMDDPELHWKCRVKISDAHVVGSQSFLRALVSFLLRTDNEEERFTNDQQRKWQTSLCAQHGVDSKPTPSDQNNQDPQRKRRKKCNEGGNFKTSQAGDGDETMIYTAVSVDDDSDEPMAMDEYGVIPWFDQIDTSHARVLGVGRAGRVTQARWNGKDVALKTISLQDDDERCLGDIYRHELDVLHSLRSLWGMHVPALLFHNPWATGPMIGLQLGGQLQDDMCQSGRKKYTKAQWRQWKRSVSWAGSRRMCEEPILSA